MRILIAGCGYVGSELARQLVASGHTVYGLRRKTAALPEGVSPVAANLLDPESLRGLPAELDAAVYAASADTYGEAGYRAAYYTGLRNVVAALAGQDSLRRLLFTSSTGVYSQDDGSWLDEDSPTPAVRPTIQALLGGESLLRDLPYSAAAVRFSGIYGPGRTRLIDSVAAGTARLDPNDDRCLNHIHRDDCAGVLAHLLGLDSIAPLYLATDCAPMPRNDLLRWIAAELGLPEPAALDAAEASSRPSERGGNRRYRNQRLLDSGYRFRYPTWREGYGALIAQRRRGDSSAS